MGIISKKNIVFHSTDKEHLTADIYLPKESQNTPIVVMFHGGAYQAGSKEMYDDWGPHLAASGYAAMSVNYRLATRNYSAYPGLIDDSREALHYLVLHAHELGLDTQRITLMGDSAGGYLATMLALEEGYTSYHINSVVSVYGVFDLTEWAAYTNETREDHVINKLFGFDAFVGKKIYEAASPMVLVDDTKDYFNFDTEFLVIWAKEDDVVIPVKQSVLFIEKLKALGIPHEEIMIPDKGHFWFTKNDKYQTTSSLETYPNDRVVPKVMNFIKRTLNKRSVMDPTTKNL